MSAVYEKIANKILAALESGVRPWIQCYSVSKTQFPVRVTGEDYRGINRLLLLYSMYENGYQSPVFMTYNQARKVGGQVRKGEKSSMSVFYSTITVDDDTTEDGFREIPFAKTNNVFNLDQIDGLPKKFMDKFVRDETEFKNNSPWERAERFIKNIPAVIKEKDRTPCFVPSLDLVYMPNIRQFETTEHFYATAFHELTHWTGHPKRLKRFDIGKKPTKEEYAFEELVAEIGASFVLPAVGIEPLIDSEHAPYIGEYIKLLKKDPKIFVSACSRAEKAADLLKSYQVAVREKVA